MPRARNYHGRQCPPPQQKSGHLHRRRHTTAAPHPSKTHHPRPSPPPAGAAPTTTTAGPYYYGYFSPHYHIPRQPIESTSSETTPRLQYNLHQESYDRELHNRMMVIRMSLSLIDSPNSTSHPISRLILRRLRDHEDDDDDNTDLLYEYHNDILMDNNGGLSEENIAANLRISTRVSNDEDKASIGLLCVVCQDDLFGENENIIATLSCGHDYHVECIKKWLLQKNCCPVCKAIGLVVN